MKSNRILICLMVVGAALLSSCSSSKKFVYLQDMKPGVEYPFLDKYESVVHRDDRLSIVVTCKQPELAIPFNMQNGTVRVASTGEVTASNDAGKGKGYRVDVDGNIEFPILGVLHVEGLTLRQVSDIVKDGIISGGYIKEPIVMVDFLNFKYTVLGAVGGNGTFTVEDDKITLLEAIAKAGDLAVNARVDNVAVIRETKNGREVFLHDLRSKDIFESPCFYLQQNDIIYVEPAYRKKDKGDKAWQYVTTMFSVISATTSVIWVTR